MGNREKFVLNVICLYPHLKPINQLISHIDSHIEYAAQ